MKTFTLAALTTAAVIHAFAAASANETQVGYTAGSVDRTIAVAAVEAGYGVIINSAFYQIGYGEGQVDRSLAVAAVKADSGVIINDAFYQIGYGEGQVDRALAVAAYSASIAVK